MAYPIKTSQVSDILEAMYDYRQEMVPLFIGAPGIGKTQGIHEFARKKGAKVVTFILSNTIPSEVSGIRMPDKESKKMEVFDDLRMASLEDGDILFFDEFLEAPPQLWASCLTLIQDRIMASGEKLKDVFIVAASNKIRTPMSIPPSTRDRFQFIELSFDFDNWVKYMFEQKGYSVDHALKSCIEGDSDQYNIFTPRRATKFIDWLQDGKMLDIKKEVILHEVSDVEYKALLNTAKSKTNNPRLAMKRVIEDVTDSYIGIDFWSKPFAEILETLQADSRWPQIKDALSKEEICIN